jgi:hypothetical protein
LIGDEEIESPEPIRKEIRPTTTTQLYTHGYEEDLPPRTPRAPRKDEEG